MTGEFRALGTPLETIGELIGWNPFVITGAVLIAGRNGVFANG
jgi:hypothetical protein